MKPLVSIIVPIYNVEPYLRKCIDSILNQTLTNIEIILVNDGSTDSCGKIIDEYASIDKRVVTVHQENEGQASARNKGLDIAKGKYLGFVDADDWIDNSMFEKLYDSVERSDSEIGICSRRTYSNKDELQYECKVDNECISLSNFGINAYIVKRLLNKHTLVVHNKIYKKEIIQENNIKFDSVKDVGSEDTLFNYKVLQHIEKIVGIEDVHYNCLAREGSTARSYDEEYMIRIGNLLKEMEDYSLKTKNNDDFASIAPIMLIHFLNRFIDRIRDYSSENLVTSLSYHIKQAMEVNSININNSRILFNKNFMECIREFGYKSKGIIFIKIFSLLCTMKMYKSASKLITMKVG